MLLKNTVTILSLNLLLVSCGLVTQSEITSLEQKNMNLPLGFLKVDVNANPLDKTVCDPFNDVPSASSEQGVKASLYYSGSFNLSSLTRSDQYVKEELKSSQKLFFADINVPTRGFLQGFKTEANDVLKNDSGEKLVEYFGLKFETILKLSEQDSEGDYELALLSDDGASLNILSGDVDHPIKTKNIDNEGAHPSTFGCATKTISMTKSTTLPIEITYFQGPRMHIANMLMWRKATVAGQDALCGRSGNNEFFNPETGAEKETYKKLLQSGWKVVSKENFSIPKNEAYNPCVMGTNPVISNFRVLEVFSEGVFLNWLTDIPSTSQVKVVDKATGEVILTSADNGVRMIHNVQVSGLKGQTTYTAEAVSISEDLGKSLSEKIEFTTP